MVVVVGRELLARLDLDLVLSLRTGRTYSRWYWSLGYGIVDLERGLVSKCLDEHVSPYDV